MIDWVYAVVFLIVLILLAWLFAVGIFAIWFIGKFFWWALKGGDVPLVQVERPEDFRIRVAEKPKALPHNVQRNY